MVWFLVGPQTKLDYSAASFAWLWVGGSNYLVDGETVYVLERNYEAQTIPMPHPEIYPPKIDEFRNLPPV